jgi:hypothetical protein
MRCYSVVLALCLGLVVASPASAQGDKIEKPDPARIEKLIQQLGSPKFAERSRARQELKQIGEPALEALRKAAKSDDAEMSRAASELVKGIEAKQLTASVLAPKRVKLSLTDVPVPEAVAELAKQSGYPIDIQGDRAALAGRKVTLNTGDTTFWEAFDQLCQKAGLVEVASPGVNLPNLPVRPPIRIKPAPGAPNPFLPPPPAPPAPPGAGAGQAQAGQAIAVAQVFQQAAGGALVPVQVQVQPPLPAVPAGQGIAQPGRIVRPGFPGVQSNGHIVVQDGKPQKVPTCYAGAVRIRAVPPPDWVKAVPAGERFVWLEVAAEPRLQQFWLTGSPQISKAVDDQGQSLTVASDAAPLVNPPPLGPAIGAVQWVGPRMPVLPGMGMGRQTVQIRLKAGQKPAKALKELVGSLSAQTLAPTEPLITIDNVLKAAGKAVKGKDGGSMEVVSIAKEANGDYKVQVRLANVPGVNPFGGMVLPGGQIQFQQIQVQVGGGGAVMVQGGVAGGGNRPSLVDAKGQAYQLVSIPSQGLRAAGGAFTQEMTLVFRPGNAQGEPASLVLSGQRTITVDVPFRLENVPLP